MIEIITAVGAGLSAAGTIMGWGAAQDISDAQQRIAQLEMQADAVRRQSMETNARRETLEAIRNMQKARAVALSNATNQGASEGSGLQGGYGQISGASAFRISGIQTALNYGRQIFDINSQINQQKMEIAEAQGTAATAQGLTSLGGTLLSNAGTISNIGAGFGSSATGGGGANTYGGWIRSIGSRGIY